MDLVKLFGVLAGNTFVQLVNQIKVCCSVSRVVFEISAKCM